ncbi:UDP-N-acetylmuramoyl-L-alanyl-D-glutamate--2,6-diaminopimelate ligase [Thermosulfurimonas dismutans]|uniref:UDP-N-acetylmuramoyl-L-alanyl-D-glutamate--2,6-diaminopimelate ligase n=1 Tax=Thermosulfurimonas dismutans TaxID=999894 RepID=A0A179D234_9BACT|nr:UDP-N-acetylmuramoyl-L-alanyl-D-glutamate--2,6-diaminopimelate ligase [Thermosulfurimonas dismutans]OAQ20134.1 UDP-N-acetylmuramoylalanyl-D-glutamate--2,6-diaminopimelate ligase [Thermosulfurimonas dismutans]
MSFICAMKLEALLQDFEVREVRGSLEVEIAGLEEDSRRLAPGYLFVARRGTRVDGHAFIREAVARGAVAVVREDELDSKLPVTQIRVADSAEALGRLCAAFYGHPERRLALIGITGTNGKSSVAWMLRTALRRAWGSCGLIGTLLYDTGGRVRKALETTPPPVTLYALLSEMVKNGAETAVLEVSSHALDQKRVAGLVFQIGVFTNLSWDHLDYHGDFETYFATKKKLFMEYLASDGLAVVNVTDPWGKRLVEDLPKGMSVFAVGRDFTGEILSRSKGLKLRILEPEGEFIVETGLFGDFQKENLLLVWAVLRGLGYRPEEVAKFLSGVSAPPGRLEPVAQFRQARIFVDYAHTPEALRTALLSVRKLASGKVLCVFGCGGNRDPGKRPFMGRVAAELADRLFITSDNPRFEDPEKIIRDILTGINGSASYRVILDRREALRIAISELSPGDVLLVAGKGHEDYQEIQGKRYPFSDAEEIRHIVAELRAAEKALGGN